MGNYKAQATAEFLAEDLKKRTGLAVVVDQSGADPVVSLGTIGAGSEGALIKVLDQRGGEDAGWDALPGFGTVQQPVYTGTVFQIVIEGISGAGAFPVTFDTLIQIACDLARRGARVELYTVTTGNPPAFAGVGFAQVAAFEPNLYWKLSSRV